MWIIIFLVLLVGGILAIPALITKIVPNSDDLLKKIAPFQAYFGIAILIWGIFNLIVNFVLSIANFFVAYGFVNAIIVILVFAIEILLGLILSMSLLKTINAIPQDKLETVEKGIEPYRVPIGLASILAALYALIFRVIIPLRF